MRGKGIASIANRSDVESKAGEIAETFRLSGLTPDKWDEFIKSENDVVKYLNIIEGSTKTKVKQSIQPKPLMKSQNPAAVFDLKGNRIKNTDNIMGGKEIQGTPQEKINWLVKNVDPNAEQTIPPKATLEAMLKDGREDLIDHFFEMHTKELGKPKINIDTSGLKHPELVKKMMMDKKLKPNLVEKLDPALYEDRGGNIIPAQFGIHPNSEIAKSLRLEAEAAKKLKNMSEAEIKLRGNRPYDTDEQIIARIEKQNKEAAERLRNKKKKLDEPDDMATGGRAGYYGGGQASTGIMPMGLGVPPSGNYADNFSQGGLRKTEQGSMIPQGGGNKLPTPYDQRGPFNMLDQFNVTAPKTPVAMQQPMSGQPLFDKDGFRLGDQRYGTGLVGGPQMALPGLTNQTPGGPMQSPTMGFQPTNAQGGESSKQMGIGSLPGNFQPTQNVAPDTQPQATFNSFDQIVNPDLKDQREQALLNLNNEFFSTPSYDPPQVPEEQKITDPYQQSESYKRQQDTTPVTTPDEVRNKGNTVAQAFGAKPGALNQALGLAYGGRAGLYQGGQAQIEPDLSNIGHGSDALMARNMLIAPGSQATTSTGLNYLLGEDNDTTRVPYNEGLKVEGPDPRILELMLNEKMSYPEALKEFENRMKQQPYIDERFNMGPGPILEAAEGGRIGYKEAGPVILPKPKPKPNADPLVELQRIYDLYQESMPGVSQETQKYLQQDFIQKLNEDRKSVV